jgi:MFS family permease
MSRAAAAGSPWAGTPPPRCCPQRSGPRGLRVPARNALLADIVPPAVYGRAYGFERAMDNLGAIGGPLLAIALVGLVGVRAAIGLSVIPGLLAAGAIIYAIRHTAAARTRTSQPIRIRIPPVLHGHLGRLMIGVTAFELGNAAATLLILRATDLFGPGRSQTAATQLALILYVLYNLAATLISVPAGWHGDRSNPIRVLAAGAVCFTAGYLVFAAGPASPTSWPPGSSSRAWESAAARPPSPPPSPPWPRPACAARHSGCSPPPRPGPTSPPAPSPESCGPSSPRPRRSCSSPPLWLCPSR